MDPIVAKYESRIRAALPDLAWSKAEVNRDGLINDDTTDVGKVHLGVVHIFDVKRPDVFPREDEIVDAGFVPLSELLSGLENMESWSQITLQALFRKG